MKKYFNDLSKLLKENIRDYGMFIALGVIFLIFAIANSNFISPRNLSNLLNQTGYIAILSIGVTLVIVIRHIDLSIGYVSGFIGAIAATLMMSYGVPPLLAIFLVMIVGLIIGLWHGFLVAFMKMPAFVATLAGMLIFRGALLRVTQGTGTIVINNDFFNNISNGYMPDFVEGSGYFYIALTIAVVVWLMYGLSTIRNQAFLKHEETKPSPVNLSVKILLSGFVVAVIPFLVVWLTDLNDTSRYIMTLITGLLATGLFVYSETTNKQFKQKHDLNSPTKKAFTTKVGIGVLFIMGIPAILPVLPDILNALPGSPEYHIVSLLVGFVAVAFYIYSDLRNYRIKKNYGFEVLSPYMLLTKIIFISLMIMSVAVILASHRGIPWTLIILGTIVAIYHFLTNFTILGRYIYAVGGNPQAAELSGISVKMVTMFVFGSMGVLSAVSGVLFASRMQSASPTAGTLFELQAIAGAFVGGVSASGGVGKIIGSVIGALVMASLSNGMQLLGINISIQYIVQGLVLVAAVIFDIRTRKNA